MTGCSVPSRRTCAWAAGIALIACLAPSGPAGADAARSAASTSCSEEAEGWQCGFITVPLDRDVPSGRSIAIGYLRMAHSDTSRPALEPIFVTEGGPGFSATSGIRGGYSYIFASLLDRRDLVLIDQRGVGRSEAIDCPALQRGPKDPYAATTACAAQLGSAADLYGSADVAADIDAVRAALGYRRINFYGASNAAVDVQAYAVRYGARLRSAILDSPVTVAHRDPWWTSAAAEMVRSVSHLCRYATGCLAANPHPARQLTWLIAKVRRRPVTGIGYDAAGVAHSVRVDEAFLAGRMLGADFGGNLVEQAELAAAAAALQRGDRTPILRLAAEASGPFFGDSGNPSEFSSGENSARYCTDNVFPWQKTASVAHRWTQFRAARRALDADRFAPFSVKGWTAPLPDNLFPDPCIVWPEPTHRRSAPVPVGSRFPAAPALVLSGDLDLFYPTPDAARVAALFPHHTLVEIRGSGHHTTFSWRGACAQSIAVRFIARLEADDTRCAHRPQGTPPTVAEFPLRAADAAPARSEQDGADASTWRDRQVVTASWQAVRNSFWHTIAFTGGQGRGLRGGTVQVTFGADAATARLTGLRFTRDVAVSGVLHHNFGDRVMTVDLVVTGPGDHSGRLHVAGVWLSPDESTLAVTGRLGGRAIKVKVSAN